VTSVRAKSKKNSQLYRDNNIDNLWQMESARGRRWWHGGGAVDGGGGGGSLSLCLEASLWAARRLIVMPARQTHFDLDSPDCQSVSLSDCQSVCLSVRTSVYLLRIFFLLLIFLIFLLSVHQLTLSI